MLSGKYIFGLKTRCTDIALKALISDHLEPDSQGHDRTFKVCQENLKKVFLLGLSLKWAFFGIVV